MRDVKLPVKRCRAGSRQVGSRFVLKYGSVADMRANEKLLDWGH